MRMRILSIKKLTLVLYFAPVVLALFCANIAQALPYNLDISAMLELGYDSNPALLTEEEKAKFENGDPSFTNISSTDDAVLKTGFDISYKFQHKQLHIEASLLYRFNKNLHNAECDYHFIKGAISARKGIWQGSLAYAFMPRYATRPFADTDEPDEPDFWATYSMNRVELDLRVRAFRRHQFCVETSLERDFYNDHFPEYDGTVFRIGPAWRWSGPIYVRLAYAYKEYDARGYDRQGEKKEDSQKSDISYAEDRIESYISRSFELLERKAQVGTSIALSRRFYTSKKSFFDDYYHIGRRDLRADISPFFGLGLSDYINTTISYGITVRRSDSPYFDLSRVKNYDRHTISLRLDYVF